MREVAVLCLMVFVVVLARYNWFRALCVLVAFDAVKNYPNLPNPIDTKGLTPWVIMFAAVLIGWIIDRVRNPRPWSLPPAFMLIAGAYLLVELVGVGRLCVDVNEFRHRVSILRADYSDYNLRAAIVDLAYVPLRFVCVAFMMLDGIRRRSDVLWALGSIVVGVSLCAFVINRQIPLGLLLDQEAEMRRVFWKWVQRHPNDLSRDFGACFWVLVGVISYRGLGSRLRLAALGIAPFLLLALAHSHSRAGYLGLACTGLVLALATRSWKAFGFLAALACVPLLFVPNVAHRISSGLDLSGGQQHDVDAITAGRNIIWPAALQGIGESPLVGHGAYGYVMSSAIEYSMAAGGGEMHPHNGYLQALLDHGLLLGWVRILPMLAVLSAALHLLRRRHSPELRLAGVAGVAFSTELLVMGVTGQQYGLIENMFLFWCAGALVTAAHRLPDVVPAPVPRAAAASARNGKAMQAELARWGTA
jgi:hypothetical protein